MTTKKHFHIFDILSITTGKLLSYRGMDGIYEILNFMCGTSLMTHQLPRAAKICGPDLLKQFPQLSNINLEGIKDFEAWRQTFLQSGFKQKYEVAALESDAYEQKDPIIELVELLKQDDL